VMAISGSKERPGTSEGGSSSSLPKVAVKGRVSISTPEDDDAMARSAQVKGKLGKVRVAMESLVKQLSLMKLSHEELFEKIDADGNGQLSRQEMQIGLRKLGITLLPIELDAVLRAFDSDGNGTVDFEEFYDVLKDYELNEMGEIAQEDDSLNAQMCGFEVGARVRSLLKPSKRDLPAFGQNLNENETGTVIGPGRLKGTVMVRFDSKSVLNVKPNHIIDVNNKTVMRKSGSLTNHRKTIA